MVCTYLIAHATAFVPVLFPQCWIKHVYSKQQQTRTDAPGASSSLRQSVCAYTHMHTNWEKKQFLAKIKYSRNNGAPFVPPLSVTSNGTLPQTHQLRRSYAAPASRQADHLHISLPTLLSTGVRTGRSDARIRWGIMQNILSSPPYRKAPRTFPDAQRKADSNKDATNPL